MLSPKRWREAKGIAFRRRRFILHPDSAADALTETDNGVARNRAYAARSPAQPTPESLPARF
jgi:hypothetical protein